VSASQSIETSTSRGDLSSAVFINLGKQKRRNVNRLRKGKGRLAEAVLETLAELKAAGNLGDGPVIVICEKKARRGFRFP
jgi:hypothetical protein